MVDWTCMGPRRNKANSGRSPVGRGQRDVGRGTNAPNEPNLVRAPRKGRGWPPDPAGARRRQTKPIARSGAPRRCPPALREGQVVCRKEVMVNGTCNRRRQNKANLPIADCRLCETNPIWPGQGWVGRGPEDEGQMRQTNPIWWHGLSRQTKPICRAYRAKQSQSPGALSGPAWADCAEQTQFGAGGQLRVERNTRNKPNLRRPGCLTIPLFQHSNPMRIAPNKPNSARPAGRPGPWEEEMCETKPIWSRLHSATGWNGTKQSQFRRVRAGVGRQMCKTNPILARRAEPMDLESATVCRPHALRSLRALCGCDQAARAIECGKQCRGRRWIRWSAIARRKWHGDD
jgi:hypothetical protein